MNIPCILVITKDSLLSMALTNLINTSNKGLVVIESNAQEIEELAREVITYDADVILLEKSNRFATEEVLTKLLMMFPKLLMIIANEESNWLHIYRREDILMTSSADLIGAIESA